ncbi:hypothetical protein E2320_010992, partial [Naja naja]
IDLFLLEHSLEVKIIVYRLCKINTKDFLEMYTDEYQRDWHELLLVTEDDPSLSSHFQRQKQFTGVRGRGSGCSGCSATLSTIPGPRKIPPWVVEVVDLALAGSHKWWWWRFEHSPTLELPKPFHRFQGEEESKLTDSGFRLEKN